MDQEQADTIGLPNLYLKSSDAQEQSEDQYRPMTPGEEEIMKIHTDGIYCSPDMIEKSGGFWITSSSVKPEESCSRQAALQSPITAASESDSELEELLRDTPEPSTLPVQSPTPGPSLTPGAARITEKASPNNLVLELQYEVFRFRDPEPVCLDEINKAEEASLGHL